MIDLHSHILPGLDDGAATIEESVAIARAGVADGIVSIAGTPHVRDDYPTSAAAMEERVALLASELADREIELSVLTGGEVALDHLPSLSQEELQRLTLAGTGRYLLVEFPYHGWPLELEDRVFRLLTAGITPVLAHPERNMEVQAGPDRLERVIRAGALVQLTASSLDGRGGRRVQATGFALLRRGLAHLIASDAHSADVRGIGMRAAAAAVGDPALAAWLTTDAPAAIVAGEALPERPGESEPRRARRGLLWRRRGS